MPEPFKLLINAPLVSAAGAHLQRVWPQFDRVAFDARALAGLDGLELKARAMQIADALEATLPSDFLHAADLIEAALGPPGKGDELSGLRTSDAGLAGWICWPLGEFVARRGLAQPARALQALHALTQRFTAEWALRPLLLKYPERVFATLEQWTRDASAHVRRLVSEGSRPRLPWGLQLKPLIVDPRPCLPLLEALIDDPSAYVRRSVANHLNDIAKDHPGLLAEFVARHLPEAGAQRRQLLRHGCRTLIKQGDARILQLFGLGKYLAGQLQLKLGRPAVVIGAALEFELQLRSSVAHTQALVIDYVIHHQRANGSSSPKVFKGWRLQLAPGAPVQLNRRHSFRPITTRKYFAGSHRIEVMVNGQMLAQASFDLVSPQA